jgi:hypothetical protein
MKDYNAIKLRNGVHNAVDEALADIAITSLKMRIQQYENGIITADEFLTLLNEVK